MLSAKFSVNRVPAISIRAASRPISHEIGDWTRARRRHVHSPRLEVRDGFLDRGCCLFNMARHSLVRGGRKFGRR